MVCRRAVGRARATRCRSRPGATRELRFAAGAPGTYYYSGQIVGGAPPTASRRRTPSCTARSSWTHEERGRANDRVLVIGLWTKKPRPNGQRGPRRPAAIHDQRQVVAAHRATDVLRRRHRALSRDQREQSRCTRCTCTASTSTWTAAATGAPTARYDGAASPPSRRDRARRRRPHVLDDVGARASRQLAVPLPRQLPRPPQRAARRPAAAARAPGARREPRAGHDGRAGDGYRGARARHGSRGARRARPRAGSFGSSRSATPAAATRSPRTATCCTRAVDDAGRRAPLLPGPTIVLERGKPVSITVVNRLREPTAVHWHGIELESYFDGVADFSGAGRASRRRSRRATRSWRGSRRRGRGRSSIIRTPTRRASSRRGCRARCSSSTTPRDSTRRTTSCCCSPYRARTRTATAVLINGSIAPDRSSSASASDTGCGSSTSTRSGRA